MGFFFHICHQVIFAVESKQTFFDNFDLNQIFLTSIGIIDVTWRNIVTIEQLEIAALLYNSLSLVITLFIHVILFR